MGSSPSYPAPPDPKETAQAQSQMNVQTALAQQKLNMVNQVTPYGSLIYTRNPPPAQTAASSGGTSAATGGSGSGRNLYGSNGQLIFDSLGNYYGPKATGDGTITNVGLHDINNNQYNYPLGQPGQPNIAALNGAPRLAPVNQWGDNGFTNSGAVNYSGGGGGNFNLGNGINYNDLPTYTATTTLSPEEQKIFNVNEANRLLMGQTGNEQLAKVRGILNTPFDLNSAINNQQADISTSLLDPVWNQREQALISRLANQGITQGSDAYTNALRDFGMQRDNAYNSALLADRQQAATEALTQRNQPLNEISALLSGSQVTMPQWINTPSVGLQSPDYMGAVQNQYNAQVAQANAQQQSQNAMLGGLFGLLSAPFGGLGLMSDRNAKKDISAVGRLNNGLTVYLFRYKTGGPFQIGLMADEVEDMHPNSVFSIGGIKHVNYRTAVDF